MIQVRSVQPKIRFLSNTTEESTVLSSGVVNFNVSKSLDDLAGSFSFTLVPGILKSKYISINSEAYIYSKINVGDMIGIGVDEEFGIMIGSVDNIYMSKDVKGRRTITIRGRDFGKFLVDDNSFPGNYSNESFNLKIQEMLVKTGINTNILEARKHPLTKLKINYLIPENVKDGQTIGFSFLGMRMEQAIKYVLQGTTSMRALITFQGEKNKPVHEIFKIFISGRSGEQIATDGYNQYTGSIANFIYSLVDREFYEVFTETITGIPVLVVRPKPYDRIGDEISGSGGKLEKIGQNELHLWDNLKNPVTEISFHEIKESEIFQINRGVSGYETASFYSVRADNDVLGLSLKSSALEMPLIDFYAIKKFGLKKKAAETELISLYPDKEKGDIEGKKDVTTKIMSYRDRLYNWNRFNHILESGNVVTIGHDKFKIGDKIFFPDEWAKNGDKGIYAYIKAYTQQWQMGGQFTTNIEFIRGENTKLIDTEKKAMEGMAIRDAI